MPVWLGLHGWRESTGSAHPLPFGKIALGGDLDSENPPLFVEPDVSGNLSPVEAEVSSIQVLHTDRHLIFPDVGQTPSDLAALTRCQDGEGYSGRLIEEGGKEEVVVSNALVENHRT